MRNSKNTLLMIVLGSLCLGAAFLTFALLISSCAGSLASSIRSDGGARILLKAEVPAPLAAKFRAFAAAGGAPDAGTSLFDLAAVRTSIAARPALSLIEIAQPNPNALRLELGVRSLEELAASPDLAGSGLLSLAKAQGWVECRIRIDRRSAKALRALLPGLNPQLMEALSPPALEDDPVTEAEYRTMLASILGSRTAAALDAAALTLTLTAPGPVLASGGGTLSDSTLTAKIPLMQALTLEKPVELWLRWGQ